MGHSVSALLVADRSGHILDRIARAWARYAVSVHHEVIRSAGTTNFALCRRAERFSLIHWLDQLRFIPCASAVKVPQMVMIHHLTPDMEVAILSSIGYCDGITTGCRYWQEKLEGLTGRTVYLLPYTIDTEIFVQPVDRAKVRADAGIESREFVLGFVGKGSADHAGRKGTDILIKTIKAGIERWSDMSLVLVGPGWEGLGRIIGSMGIRVKSFQYNTTEDTAQAYWLMDTLLVTSSEEGGPCTILEAMAAGVPVITSVVGHVAEIIRDGETGFICSERDPAEYIRAIANLRGDGALRRRVVAQAREFVVRERDDRVVIPRMNLASVYADAVAHYHSRLTGELAPRSTVRGKLWIRHAARTILNKGWS